MRHFFQLAEKEGLPAKQIEAAALDRLRRYRWPGNIRELENLVRRLAALYPQDVITRRRHRTGTDPARHRRAPSRTKAGEEGLMQSVERHLHTYFGEFGDGLRRPASTTASCARWSTR